MCVCVIAYCVGRYVKMISLYVVVHQKLLLRNILNYYLNLSLLHLILFLRSKDIFRECFSLNAKIPSQTILRDAYILYYPT